MIKRSFHLLPAIALLVLLFTGVAFAQRQPGQITIACYNLENMFDVFDDPYTSDESTRVKSRESIEKIATAIRKMNPDVMTVSEVENEGVLRAMVHEWLHDMGYTYIAVLPTNAGRGINVGVISRVPIVSLTSHRFLELPLEGESRTWRFARDLLQVKLQVTKERTLDLFAVHFKSRHDSPDDTNSTKWRSAEAAMTRKVVENLLKNDPDAWVAVGGDFNDTPENDPIRILLQPGESGRSVLHDVHADLPADQRITYLRPPYRSTIDYLLVSDSLSKRLVPGSAKLLNETEHRDILSGSDHAPIMATFDLSK